MEANNDTMNNRDLRINLQSDLILQNTTNVACTFPTINTFKDIKYIAGQHDPDFVYRKVLRLLECDNSTGSLQQPVLMREAPANLTDWYVVPYPCGIRCLMVCVGGIAYVFNEYGTILNVYVYDMPIAKEEEVNVDDASIFEGVFNRDTGIYFVVDILYYESISFVSQYTFARFNWLKENAKVFNNFTALKLKEKKLTNIVMAMIYEMSPEVFRYYPTWLNDAVIFSGFRFYYKYSDYLCGFSPYVMFLHNFLVPKVLGCSIYPKANPLLISQEAKQKKPEINCSSRSPIAASIPDQNNDVSTHDESIISITPLPLGIRISNSSQKEQGAYDLLLRRLPSGDHNLSVQSVTFSNSQQTEETPKFVTVPVTFNNDILTLNDPTQR